MTEFLKMYWRKALGCTPLTISLFAFLVVGCRGDTGPTGSQGPAGPAGPPGSPNVQYSQWFSPSVWSGSMFDWYFDTTASSITQSVIDSGVVLAYMKFPNDSMLVRPLPVHPTSASVLMYSYFIPAVGKIRFSVISNDGGDVPSTLVKFRYVVIPGGVKLAKDHIVDYVSHQDPRSH